MDDQNNNMDDRIDDEEEGSSYFCRFTFGQFFTILVLEVITLAFVFYLGAKYGTNYLKVADDDAAAASSVNEIVAKGTPDGTQLATSGDTELQALAKDAMRGAADEDIKARVREILAKNGSQGAAAALQPQLPQQQQVYQPSNGMPQQDAMPNQPVASQVPSPTPLKDDPNIEKLMAQAQAQQVAQITPPQQQVPVAERPAQVEPPVQKQQPPEQGVVRMKSPAGSPYSIQVGSYPNMEEASAKVEDWRGRGYAAFMMIADIPDRGRWYRVRIGGFPSKEDAQTYLEKFKAGESTEAIIVLNEQ